MLRHIEGYQPLPRGPASVIEFVALCDASGTVDAVDTAFAALPSEHYKLVPQLSKAWFALRARVPVTGSRLWGLSLLSLLPSRRRGDYNPDPRIVRPPHRVGVLHPSV